MSASSTYLQQNLDQEQEEKIGTQLHVFSWNPNLIFIVNKKIMGLLDITINLSNLTMQACIRIM
jgi:hypothetical protein